MWKERKRLTAILLKGAQHWNFEAESNLVNFFIKKIADSGFGNLWALREKVGATFRKLRTNSEKVPKTPENSENL